MAQHPSHGRRRFGMSVCQAAAQHMPEAWRTVTAYQSSALQLLWRALVADADCRAGCRVICQHISLLSVGRDARLESAGPGMWHAPHGPVECSSGDGCPSAISWPRQAPKYRASWLPGKSLAFFLMTATLYLTALALHSITIP